MKLLQKQVDSIRKEPNNHPSNNFIKEELLMVRSMLSSSEERINHLRTEVFIIHIIIILIIIIFIIIIIIIIIIMMNLMRMYLIYMNVSYIYIYI